MKKILSIILLVCSSYLLRAQFSITQNLGSPNTLVKNPNYGGLQGGLIPFTFTDTSSANTLATALKTYAGALIYTTSPRAVWWRDAAVSQWIQVLPGGGSGSLGAWTTTLNTTIPTDLSLNGYFGTTAANGIGFYTTNTQRVILPAGGLTLKAVVSDTTLNKPMVWNTSTKEWNYGYWYGGGSGTTPISSLTAAAASNSISNANYTQQWGWALTGGNVALALVNTTTTAVGNEKVFEISTNGAHSSNNITTFGQKVTNSHTGTGSINIALQAQAVNGDENISFWANRGKVRFGTNGTEKGVLEILGNTSGTITIQPQPTAGTYNLNLPTTAGTSGYLLTSAGGGASPMTWTDPASLTTPLSKLTAASATNSIDNANYGQTWAWDSKTSGNALSLGINGTAALSGQTVLDIKSQGANSGSAKVTYGLQITNSKTGTTSVNYAANFIASGGEQTHGALITSSGSNTANGISAFAQGIGANVGGRFGATGGTSNYAILVAPSEGSVGIGTLTPDSTLHVFGGFKYVNGSQGAGKVLTSDANGGATWGTISTGLTVGTTSIASGTDTKVLYNNAGTLGEYTISGTGNVAMTTSPTFTTPALGTPSALVGTNITGTAASLTAGNATTLATSRNLNGAAFNGSADVVVPDQNPSIMALLGSTILAEPITGDVYKTSSSTNLTDGQVRWVAVYIPRSMTITGVKFMQQTQGSYTADNYNGVGLYSYSGGNLTLVASSTDDGNIWKATSFTWSSKAFSSTYAASAGLYFVALLYNSSAQTTAPALRANQLSSDLLNTVDFTNTAKAGSSLTGQTGFPAGPTAMSTLTTNSAIPYLALY